MVQSQSKLLGHFAVFLPSQCWCARFGFNCDKQHWEDEEMGQKLKKTGLGGRVPTIVV